MLRARCDSVQVHDNALSSKLKTCTTLAMGPWRWRVRWILVVVAVIVTVTAMAAQGPILLATDVYYWDVITAG